MVIIGNVIRIPDRYSVVINVGRKHNVSTGMSFMVYEEGEPIIAPDGTNLGKIEHVKALVRVTHVQKEFSIAETWKSDKVTTVSSSIFNSLAIRKSLPVSEDEIEPFRSFSKEVKVGDLVKQIELPE